MTALPRSIFASSALAALAALPGCRADQDGYLVRGSVSGPEAPDMHVALLWTAEGGGCVDQAARVAVNERGDFRLVLQGAPPPGADVIQTRPEYPPVARATIVALDEQSRLRGVGNDLARRVIYQVFYAPDGVPGNDGAVGIYGGTQLRAGYQLGFFAMSETGGPRVILTDGEHVRIETGSSGGLVQRLCSAR